jgi:hypothetical protein
MMMTMGFIMMMFTAITMSMMLITMVMVLRLMRVMISVHGAVVMDMITCRHLLLFFIFHFDLHT